MSGLYLAQTEHNLNSWTALDCTFTLGNSVCVCACERDFIMGHGDIKTEARLLCVWHINGLGAAVHKFIYIKRRTCGRTAPRRFQRVKEELEEIIWICFRSLHPFCPANLEIQTNKQTKKNRKEKITQIVIFHSQQPFSCAFLYDSLLDVR